MDDVFTAFWTDLVGRLTGPMTFRLILQPTMAALNAIRDGLTDARAGKPPYSWSVLTDRHHRGQLLREGASSEGRVILLGSAMDAIYQWIVFRWIHPVELVVVVLLLAFVPYVLLRGPVNRIARARHR